MHFLLSLWVFLSGGDQVALRIAKCDVVLHRVPGETGDAVAVKWVCR
jgi:hypothetical protein